MSVRSMPPEKDKCAGGANAARAPIFQAPDIARAVDLIIAICDTQPVKTIVYTPAARRALREHANHADLILTKIEQYAAAPAAQANNVKKLKGRPDYRLRVGNFRIVFSETADTITIYDIGPRRGIYD